MDNFLSFGNSINFSQQLSGSLLLREQIEEEHTWNLNDIYPTEEAWEKDFKWIETNLAGYRDFEGSLGSSVDTLLKAIHFDDEISIKLSRLHLYANSELDLDLLNSASHARNDRINSLISQAAAASAFINPEILAIPEEQIDKFMEQSPELKVYKQQFENLFRRKEHTLSKELEELLARSSEISDVPENAFGVFTNAELKFPTVLDSSGLEVQISQGRFRAALYSHDREYRRKFYKGFYKPFQEYKNTLSTLFQGNIKTHIFYAAARKYKSAIEAALNINNIPIAVYDNLVKTVNNNLQPLHRWAAIKKRVLKLDELHPYDAYVTLFPKVTKQYSFKEAKAMVITALKPFGEQYIADLELAFNSRWIDVYETKGKRSGAYSSGTTYGVHPFVLLNWNDTLDDVFTLAHEMGHNMHSYYTGENQPYPYANYSIFVAEVASTTNEALLLDYLIDQASTSEEKLSLIEIYLNNITTTFYRQTGFAEFEQRVHELAEQGQALTSDLLTPMYHELTQRYWGPEMIIDEEEDYTWARVPHFYYNFYVYQYATGYAASQALVDGLKTEGKLAVNRYLDFLKAGSSDYPINVLKTAGVDMESPIPINKTISKMNELLDQLEMLLDQ